MGTRSRWTNGILTFYDDITFETVRPVAPVYFYDDFLGYQLMLSETGSTGQWEDTITTTLGAPTIALVADGANGQAALTIANSNEIEGTVLSFADQRQFVLTQGCIFEARINLAVLPIAGEKMVWGLAGDTNVDPDAITYSIWFAAAASGAVVCETDDNATPADGVTSGTTLVNTDWAIFKIDCTDVTDIRFYINGEHVAPATTFAYAATGANATLQPYFACYKASGVGTATLKVDYVRVWQKRS